MISEGAKSPVQSEHSKAASDFDYVPSKTSSSESEGEDFSGRPSELEDMEKELNVREVSTDEDHTSSFEEKKATDDHPTNDECEEKGEHTRDTLDDEDGDLILSLIIFPPKNV